jgi:hypothetical protein
MEPEHPAEIRIRLPIALQTPEHGAPKDEELGLVGGSSQPVGQDLDCVRGLFEAIEQTGKMKPTLDVLGFHLQQLAVRSDRVSRERPRGQIIGLL